MITGQKNSPKQGFFIGVGCPGCGGEIEIDADFFVTKCRHCGSPLRLTLPETPPAYLIPFKLTNQEARIKIDRKLKELNLPLTGQPLHFKNIYYPYWKIDAMLLRCRNRKEKVTVAIDDSSGEETIDYKNSRTVNLSPYQTTVAASNFLPGIPDTIGIRGQTLRAVPFASTKIEEDYLALDVKRVPNEVFKTIELSLLKLNNIEMAEFGQNVTRIFNPSASLIFFPFNIVEDYAGAGFRRYVLDGLTGRIIFSSDSDNETVNLGRNHLSGSSIDLVQDEIFGAGLIETRTEFTETDLPESGIRFNDADNPDGENIVKFGEVKIGFHRCRECGEDLPAEPACVYICHNCHELTCLDPHLKVKTEVLVAEPLENPQSQFFPFWQFRTDAARHFGALDELDKIIVPAFQIANFEALYRLSRRTTTASGRFDFSAVEFLNGSFRSVDVLPSQAIALANVVFYRYALEKNNKIPTAEPAIDINSSKLCFIPFQPENYFFTDSVLKSITFEKSLAAR